MEISGRIQRTFESAAKRNSNYGLLVLHEMLCWCHNCGIANNQNIKSYSVTNTNYKSLWTIRMGNVIKK